MYLKVRFWALGEFVPVGVSLLPGLPVIKLENRGVSANPHIGTDLQLILYLSIFVSVCLSSYLSVKKKHEFILMSWALIQHHKFYPSFPPLLIYNLLLCGEKPVLHYYNLFMNLYNHSIHVK